MTSKVHNPRGYAYVAFAKSYRRHLGYNWFAILNGSRLTPSNHKWLWNGMEMFDRMVLGIDASDEDELKELVGTIEKALSRSVMEGGKGRILWPDTRADRPGKDRMSLTLDQAPPQEMNRVRDDYQTVKDLIPELSDPFAEYDEWDELRQRLRDLWPKLSVAERKYVAAQIDEPDANARELAERFGQSRQMADLMLRRVRAKAQA